MWTGHSECLDIYCRMSATADSRQQPLENDLIDADSHAARSLLDGLGDLSGSSRCRSQSRNHRNGVDRSRPHPALLGMLIEAGKPSATASATIAERGGLR